MIITSLLDTDLYKFTMMQVVLHQFPGAQVEYRFNAEIQVSIWRPMLTKFEAKLSRFAVFISKTMSSPI